MTLDTETPDSRRSSFLQLFVVIILTAGFSLGGTAMAGLAGSVLVGLALLLFSVGCSYVLMTVSPPERFEVGTLRAGHQYNEVQITAEVEIHYDETDAKLRTVECTAVTEDETTIIQESDTETVGTEPEVFGLVGGDFQSVRSTTDHILAVSASVHEYIDEWVAAGGNDPAIKATLETEFETAGLESHD